MLVPLSGPWPRQGILEQMGARMAIDDINNAGGIKALGGAKLRLIEYDTGDSAEKAKDAAQRMIAQEPDLVGGFGCWLSTFTLAATEMTERMTQGVLQPDGELKVEPRMDVNHVAQQVAFMASLPLESNVAFVTVMATKMPLFGRG